MQLRSVLGLDGETLESGFLCAGILGVWALHKLVGSDQYRAHVLKQMSHADGHVCHAELHDAIHEIVNHTDFWVSGSRSRSRGFRS